MEESFSTARQHYLDDPFYDFASDSEEGIGRFFWVLGIAVVLLLGLHAYNRWTEPPIVKFQPVIVVKPNSLAAYSGSSSTVFTCSSPSGTASATACTISGGGSGTPTR